MSRIANNPVIVPEKVTIQIDPKCIEVKGPLGTLSQSLGSEVVLNYADNKVTFAPVGTSLHAHAMSGTLRALVANMIIGVSKGWEKKLNLVGVGYRAQAAGDKLNLTLGYSHPVVHQMPMGVKVETPTQTEIIIRGTNRQQVGQVAADVRAYRKPEPYKGKGVRYSDEKIILKETKKK